MVTPAKANSPQHVLPVMLAFSAGFVEAITYMGLFHTFVTFITGTLLIMIVDLVSGTPGALIKGAVFFCFFVFSVVWIVLSRMVRRDGRQRTAVFLAIESGCILLVGVLGTALAPLEEAGSGATLAVSVAAIFAMSLHSVMFFTMMNATAPSHFMTGNLTHFCRGLVETVVPDGSLLAAAPEERAATAHRVRHFPLVIVGFVAGVTLGAAGFLWIGFAALLVPSASVLAAAWVAARPADAWS